jgi:AMMECR1 domain-containing protein
MLGQIVLIVLLASLLASSAWAGESTALPQAVRRTMALYFNQETSQSYSGLIRELSGTVKSRRPAGVFVTLSKAGKPRACWGSIFPQHKTILESTVYATLGALGKDYRYPPITRTEWSHLKPQVTVVRAIEPIESIREVNPLRDGLMVRAGGRSGVMLPGETTDATYQLVQARLKAGIRPNTSYQLYRIIADVYR